jgi:hypothetical protein
MWLSTLMKLSILMKLNILMKLKDVSKRYRHSRSIWTSDLVTMHHSSHPLLLASSSPFCEWEVETIVGNFRGAWDVEGIRRCPADPPSPLEDQWRSQESTGPSSPRTSSRKVDWGESGDCTSTSCRVSSLTTDVCRSSAAICNAVSAAAFRALRSAP